MFFLSSFRLPGKNDKLIFKKNLRNQVIKIPVVGHFEIFLAKPLSRKGISGLKINSLRRCAFARDSNCTTTKIQTDPLAYRLSLLGWEIIY
jgi:hypothetical protein